jgi:hypothetical protein
MLYPKKPGGWSLLLVGGGELEVGASLNVILKEKHSMVFSRIGFSCEILVYYALCGCVYYCLLCTDGC